MNIRNKPFIERLFFEKFFTEPVPFNPKKWKLYEKNAYNAIQESIAQNIHYILNTTNGLTIDEYLEKKLTFLDFGVPDFVSMYEMENISEQKMIEVIHHAITSFEPRLIEVSIERDKENENIINVEGKIKRSDLSFFQIVYYNLK